MEKGLFVAGHHSIVACQGLISNDNYQNRHQSLMKRRSVKQQMRELDSLEKKKSRLEVYV